VERTKQLFWEWRYGKAVRSGDWKTVQHGDEETWFLFNVVTDPSETTDLASAYPDKLKELVFLFKFWKE
jgi:arylsulfatase A-like enzyme